MNLLRRIRDHARSVRIKDGRRVFLRPLREADFAHANEFFERLSEQTKYLRFMMATPNLTGETLARLADTLHAARAAVTVAIVDHGHTEELVGGVRVVPTAAHAECEFALTVADAWQGRGLGTALLREAVRLGRTLGYRRIVGRVLTINHMMLTVAHRLKFAAHADPDDPGVTTVSRLLGR